MNQHRIVLCVPSAAKVTAMRWMPRGQNREPIVRTLNSLGEWASSQMSTLTDRGCAETALKRTGRSHSSEPEKRDLC